MTKLREVLTLLREGGWIKGDLVDPVTGAVCLRGAVNCAHFGDVHGGVFGCEPLSPDALADIRALANVIDAQYPERVKNLDVYVPLGTDYALEELIVLQKIPEFNDHSDTVFEDIEIVSEKAAVQREAEL
jgi:hypothetical protein